MAPLKGHQSVPGDVALMAAICSGVAPGIDSGFGVHRLLRSLLGLALALALALVGGIGLGRVRAVGRRERSRRMGRVVKERGYMVEMGEEVR